ELPNSKLINSTLIKAEDTFKRALMLVAHEHRYGKILNRDEDVQFLMQLFIHLHKKHDYIDTFYALRSWDEYTYLHSIDTFILGTLFAKKHGVHNIELVALGFLFHDIGKTKIPQKLLSKRGKLTYREFEIIKKHTTE